MTNIASRLGGWQDHGYRLELVCSPSSFIIVTISPVSTTAILALNNILMLKRLKKTTGLVMFCVGDRTIPLKGFR